MLFSPEVSLMLDEPSVTENAALDVLPWNVPTNAYLHGLGADDPAVSLLRQDLSYWPPTFVAYGRDETRFPVYLLAVLSAVLLAAAWVSGQTLWSIFGTFHPFGSWQCAQPPWAISLAN